ncbi:MAG: hypothetical protein QMD06_02685 [Candidatus Altarchaeum sp.]|nr:hypothetical protein [Candidatus Altarchaeum sp.]
MHEISIATCLIDNVNVSLTNVIELTNKIMQEKSGKFLLMWENWQ